MVEGIDFNRVRSIKQDGISIEIAESDQIKLKANKKKKSILLHLEYNWEELI